VLEDCYRVCYTAILAIPVACDLAIPLLVAITFLLLPHLATVTAHNSDYCFCLLTFMAVVPMLPSLFLLLLRLVLERGLRVTPDAVVTLPAHRCCSPYRPAVL